MLKNLQISTINNYSAQKNDLEVSVLYHKDSSSPSKSQLPMMKDELVKSLQEYGRELTN